MKDRNLQRICPRSDKKPVTSIKGFLWKKEFLPNQYWFYHYSSISHLFNAKIMLYFQGQFKPVHLQSINIKLAYFCIANN